jgi:hypothetical protein
MDSNSDSNLDSEIDLYSDSASEIEYDSEPPSPILSEPSSKTSLPHPKHSIGARIQAVTFLELNIPYLEITAKTGISKAQLYKLRDKAISRGWDPKVSGIVEVHHVEDATRSGRLKTSQNVIDLILKTVTQNSTTRGWSCIRIAYKVSTIPRVPQVSGSTVWRVLLRKQVLFL